MDLSAINNVEWEEEMKSDLVLQDVKKLLLLGTRIERTLPVSVRPFHKIMDEHSVCNGIFMCEDKFLPPVGPRAKILQIARKGHLG